MDEKIKPCSSTVSTDSVSQNIQPRPRVKTPPPLGPITVHFVVHCRFIRPHELVFLTGNLERLGHWEPDKAIELVQDRWDESVWRTTIQLPTEETRELLKFRYFIGFYLQAANDPSPKLRVISRWEAQRMARALMPSVEADLNLTCRLKHVDEFGVYGGREVVSDGWLNHTAQNEILLRLHGDAMKFFKPRHISRTYYVKVTPFDLRHKEEYAPYSNNRQGIRSLWRMPSLFSASIDDEDGEAVSPLPIFPSFSPTDLAILSNDDPSFKDQKQSGSLFRNNIDYFIYRTQTVAAEFVAFRIEFFAERSTKKTSSSSEPPKSANSVDSNSDRSSTVDSKVTTSDSSQSELNELDSNLKENGIKKENGLTSSKNQNETTNLPGAIAAKKDEITAKTEADINEASATKPVYLLPDEPPVPKDLDKVALAYILPSSLAETSGLLSVPILSKTNQLPIGQLTIDYLSTRALSVQSSVPLTMETSFARYWRQRRTVEVGHRGAGVSTTRFSAIRENTLHSMNHAANLGADFVEFDVQLTKDNIPIIFHDFHVLIRVAKRLSADPDSNQLKPDSANVDSHSPTTFTKNNKNNAEFHEIAVKDLKLQQLHLLHVEHYQAPNHKDKLPLTSNEDESYEFRPFPTLVHALKHVNPEVGFNIEIKFPMLLKDGSHECTNFFERNEYIDRILKDVIEYSGQRRILFSSFEPDICSMIARKQSYYPVLFLCVGNTARYMPFLDKRSSISITAVNFAVNTHILGVNFHSEELLRDKRPIQRAKHFNLVSFVWGDDLDNLENIEYFRSELKLEGIVYDKVGEMESRKNCFIVEREVKNILFSPVVSASPSRRSSIDDPSGGLINVASVPLLNIPGQLTKEEMGSTDALLLAGMRPKSPLQMSSASTTPIRMESPVDSTSSLGTPPQFTLNENSN